jgi:Na+/melibiose symporter-like transporter
VTFPQEQAPEEAKRKPESIFHDRNFLRFWSAITVAGVGGQVSLLALPLTAVIFLEVNAAQVGLLTAAQTIPMLLISPLAGVVTDRFPARTVNSACDIARGIILLGIPVLAAFHLLTFARLCLLAGMVGCLKTVADVAHHSMLPRLISRDKIVPGNAAVSTSYSVTEVAGPGIGGVLIQAFSAPYAIVVDAFALIVSGTVISTVKTHYEQLGQTREKWLHMVRDGFTYLFRERALLMLGLSGGVANLFLGAYESIFAFYAVTTLGFTASSVGLLYVAGAVGGIIGAIFASRLGRRFSEVKTMTGGNIVAGLALLVIAGASGATDSAIRFLPVIVGIVVYSLGQGIYNVHSISIRQLACPPEMLGRLTAGYRLLSQGSLPIGAVLGGLVAEKWGPDTTISLAGLGVIVWMLLVQFTSFRKLTSLVAFRRAEAP